MSIALLLLLVFAAGGVGGVVNALLSDNGFVVPRGEQAAQTSVTRPGLLVNLVLGGVAAVVSWGLYGPLAGEFLAGGAPPAAGQTPPGLTLAGFVGAVLVGMGGARWLTNEVDKKLLRAAAVQAADVGPKAAGQPDSTPADSHMMAALNLGTPAEALRAANTAGRLTFDRVKQLAAANNNCPAVSTELLVCLIWKESRFDPKAKNPNSTATGLMQMTTGAVDDVNHNTPAGTHFTHAEMTDAARNIACGSHYLRLRIERAGGDVKRGLEGFGTGPGYATNIMTCEACLTAAPADPTGCLTPIGS